MTKYKQCTTCPLPPLLRRIEAQGPQPMRKGPRSGAIGGSSGPALPGVPLLIDPPQKKTHSKITWMNDQTNLIISQNLQAATCKFFGHTKNENLRQSKSIGVCILSTVIKNYPTQV